MPVIRRDIGEQIHPDGKFNVARIEIYQVVRAFGRNVIQQFLGQITVWVNQSNAMSKLNVLNDQIAEQCGFARAGFSNDVNMPALVTGRYAKRLRLSVAFAVSDHNVWFVRFQNQPPLRKSPWYQTNAGRMFLDRPAG